jgi:anti-sigma B factor antagonist
MNVTVRFTEGITILQVEGKILVGEPSQMLHDAVRQRLTGGDKKLVLHLAGVTYIDSSGVGQLVGALSAARKAGGELRLADLTPKVKDLMMMTNLNKLFDLDQDETTAVRSLK